MQIFTVAAAVATVAVQRMLVVTLRVAIATELATIVVRLRRAPMSAIVPQRPTVASAIAIIGTDVATVTSDIAAVAAEIPSVGADVARVAANVARALRAERLRSRSCLGACHGGSTGRKRHHYAQCNQLIAKHL